MSMWRDQGPNKKDGVPVTPEVAAADGRLFTAEASPAPPVPAATPSVVPAAAPTQRHSEAKESLIAADISIEGKIEGAGHVRLAGRFKGDVNVKGDLTIERGEAAILYCYALGKAQRVLAELRAWETQPALLHGAVAVGVE
ncbi:hypothetical protein QT787_12710, partial [Xanthomonas citri pv. citri]